MYLGWHAWNRGCIQTLPLPSALTVQKCSNKATSPDIPFHIKMNAVGSPVFLWEGCVGMLSVVDGNERCLYLYLLKGVWLG